jgi:FlaA1/EpsC-like NDP-sugar epimerase
MGLPSPFRDLAEQMIRLAGKPARDRHRHRLHRACARARSCTKPCCNPEEQHAQTVNARVFRSEMRDVDSGAVLRSLERLDTLLKSGQGTEVMKSFLRETVHDYRPAGNNVVPISGYGKTQTHR